VKEQYCSRVLRAEQLFFYHPVYNPGSRNIAYFIKPNVSSNLNNSTNNCDDGRNKSLYECDLYRDSNLNVQDDDDHDNDDNNRSYPEISMNELLKLGGTAEEVACLPHINQPHKQLTNDYSKQKPSPIAINDICEGVYYIKDHDFIQPNYPWYNLPSNSLSACSNASKNLRHELMRSVNYLHHSVNTQPDSKYVQKSLSFPSCLSTPMLMNMTRRDMSVCVNNQFAPSFNKPQSVHNIYTSSSSSVQLNKDKALANPTCKRSHQEAFGICIPSSSSKTSISIPLPTTKKGDIFESFKYSSRQQQQVDCTPNYRRSIVISTDTCKQRDEVIVTPNDGGDDRDDDVVKRDDESNHHCDELRPPLLEINKNLPMKCTVYDLTGDDTTHRSVDYDSINDKPSVIPLNDERHGNCVGTGTGERDDKENEFLSVYDLVELDQADIDPHDNVTTDRHDKTCATSSAVHITPDPFLRSLTIPLKSTTTTSHLTNRVHTQVVTATKRKTLGPLSSITSSRSPASNKNKRAKADIPSSQKGSLGGIASIRSFFKRVI